ncbi:MAG: hypothetical protein GX359_03105 [Clostridiales bacterium]|nr:hypothetical protein [Clostridiales bacterium]
MNKRNKIIITGAVFAVLVITIISFSNKKANKTLTEDINAINTAQNSILDAENADDTDASIENSAEIMITKAPEATWEVTDAIISEIEGIVKKYYSADEFNEEVLVNDNVEDQEEVKEEITQKRDGIEAYKDITVLVRKGLEKDTFVTFVSYLTKFINIDTLVPGMSVLYIVPDEEGKLGIQNTPDDEKLAEYINTLLKEEEIATLVEDVNSGFVEALDKDENLKTFVEKLTKEADNN